MENRPATGVPHAIGPNELKLPACCATPTSPVKSYVTITAKACGAIVSQRTHPIGTFSGNGRIRLSRPGIGCGGFWAGLCRTLVVLPLEGSQRSRRVAIRAHAARNKRAGRIGSLDGRSGVLALLRPVTSEGVHYVQGIMAPSISGETTAIFLVAQRAAAVASQASDSVIRRTRFALDLPRKRLLRRVADTIQLRRSAQ